MITVGIILNTVEDTQYRGGYTEHALHRLMMLCDCYAIRFTDKEDICLGSAKDMQWWRSLANSKYSD